MIPQAVMQVLATMVMLGCLTMGPVNQITQFEAPGGPSSVSSADTFPQGKAGVWEPDAADVAMISRTIWGEVRGCPYDEQWAQGCCVLNRVDDPRWGDTIEAVVTQPYQFQGYSPSNPDEPFRDMAREILIAWHNGDTGVPKDMCFCGGDGKHQTFRTEWIPTEGTRYWP